MITIYLLLKILNFMGNDFDRSLVMHARQVITESRQLKFGLCTINTLGLNSLN